MFCPNNEELKQFVEEAKEQIHGEKDIQNLVNQVKERLATVDEEGLRVIIYFMGRDLATGEYPYPDDITGHHLATCKVIAEYIEGLQMVDTINTFRDAGADVQLVREEYTA